MVCATVAEKDASQCREALKKCAFAEVRMDLMDIDMADVPSLFAGGTGLIATCRPGRMTDRERMDLLMAAIDEGAEYVDVEMESAEDYREPIVERARQKGCKVIISYHNYVETPGRAELEGIVSRCFDAGADLAKIACAVKSPRDNARLIGLADSERPVVVIGMGALGAITRIAAPLLGSPFTYGAYEKGREVVEGQLDHRTIMECHEVLRKIATGAPAGVTGQGRRG